MGIKLVHQVLQLILRAKFALGMMAILKESDWYLGIQSIEISFNIQDKEYMFRNPVCKNFL
jgi:hypothetical protein